ncbi:Protein CBG26525 [Caenorhabditis briggsae]|uniref:Protein CBG26525 n=1 Tax=Caenorhabditis briggsae TaxID=6238 RepID=B6IHV6_CAEBR|nr:Protein CBG26525 [Caenorhabditis briggsae]CAR99486.1 Protein CBG26525 [Caenorhabditis briggsae]
MRILSIDNYQLVFVLLFFYVNTSSDSARQLGTHQSSRAVSGMNKKSNGSVND